MTRRTRTGLQRTRDLRDLRGLRDAPGQIAWRRIVVAGIAISVVVPILPLIVQSFAGRWLYPDILPDGIDMRAWAYVAQPQSRVLLATVRSLAIALSVTAICMVIGVPAGRGLVALKPLSRGLGEFLFFAPVIIPSLAVALGLHVIFVRLGLADTMVGVIISHLLPTLPYMVLVMTSTFSHADPDMEAQARTLGAGPLRAFVIVGLPTAAPGVLTGALFVFLISWSQYALTLLVGGGRVFTLPLLLFAFASSGDLALTAALAIVFLTPAVLILALTARFVSGRSVALGGVAAR